MHRIIRLTYYCTENGYTCRIITRDYESRLASHRISFCKVIVSIKRTYNYNLLLIRLELHSF